MNSQDRFLEKHSYIKFHENTSSGSRVVPCGQTDEQSLRRLFQITNLMRNSFILQQYVCYSTILSMFRAAPCSSSEEQIVLPQPLVSSLSVNSRTVCRLRADCSPLSTGIKELCIKLVI